jgi:hypothetical protein
MAYEVHRLRDYRPHAEVLWGAQVLLKHSAEQREGQYYQWAAAMLFSAFAFEGYLNYLGLKRFPSSWEDEERTHGGWRGKTKKIAANIGFSLDEKSRPFETLTRLFEFRDRMAHPRPIPLKDQDVKYVTDTYDFQAFKPPGSDAEPFCTEANARLCIEDVKHMITLLHNQANEGGGNPLLFGHESGLVTPAT